MWMQIWSSGSTINYQIQVRLISVRVDDDTSSFCQGHGRIRRAASSGQMGGTRTDRAERLEGMITSTLTLL